MEKKEKIFKIILIILIVFILGVIYNVISNGNRDKKTEIVNETNDVIDKIKNIEWVYIKSDFYNHENELSPALSSNFTIVFNDTKVEICFEDVCLDSEYTIDESELIINSIDGFLGRNNIFYEDDNFVLEHFFDDGSRIIYYFSKPVG